MKSIKFLKDSNTLTKVLFGMYLIVLAWVILLKADFTLEGLQTLRKINFVPFESSTIVNNKIYMREIYLNIIIFIPFGIYLSMLKDNLCLIEKSIIIFCVSLFFEVTQYIFAIGGADITDLISNTLGGIVGVLFYGFVLKISRNKEKTNKILNRFAFLGTMGVVLLIGFVGSTTI